MAVSVACWTLCKVGYLGCEAKNILKSTDCIASNNRCQRDCTGAVIRQLCKGAVDGLSKSLEDACHTARAAEEACRPFCVRLPLAMTSEVVALGGGPEDEIADGLATAAGTLTAAECYSACLGAYGAACQQNVMDRQILVQKLCSGL
jgi:hypothetical protein